MKERRRRRRRRRRVSLAVFRDWSATAFFYVQLAIVSLLSSWASEAHIAAAANFEAVAP